MPRLLIFPSRAPQYAGLYSEACRDQESAGRFISEALDTPYAHRHGGDYMVDVAAVHYNLRGYGSLASSRGSAS